MLGLAIAVLFIALNGFFVAAEFALVKVRATQLHSRVRKGEKKAIVASAVISRLDRYLSVTQFGITLASLGLGWVGEPAAARLVEQAVSDRTLHPAARPRGGRHRRRRLRRAHVRPRPVRGARPEARRDSTLGEDGPVRRGAAPSHLLHLPASALGARARHAGDLARGRAQVGRRERGDAFGGRDPRRPRRRRGAEHDGRVEARSSSSGSCASRSAPHATRWFRAWTSPISRSRRSGREALAFLQAAALLTRVLLSREKSLDEIAGYLYSKDFLLAEARRPSSRTSGASGATCSSCRSRRPSWTSCARCSARTRRSPSWWTSTVGPAGS